MCQFEREVCLFERECHLLERESQPLKRQRYLFERRFGSFMETLLIALIVYVQHLSYLDFDIFKSDSKVLS